MASTTDTHHNGEGQREDSLGLAATNAAKSAWRWRNHRERRVQMVKKMLMEAFLLFSVFAAFVGAVLAWFHRRTFWNLCLRTALATLVLIAVAILILDGPPV